jgi:CxxC-x17-CxxC domain-containing protein
VSFDDKTLVCRDCGNEFIFTSGEQEFYSQKGFDNEPTRCTSCRQARKNQRNTSSYDRGGSSSSYGGGSSYSSGGRSDRAPREMHTTTCSGCGQPAQVPFVPRGDAPVYCRECFQNQRNSRSSNSRW